MLRRRGLSLALVLMLCLSVFPVFSGVVLADETPIYQDKSYSFEERAADMVARMTAAQKGSQMISEGSAAIPALGISSYTWWNEAIHGHSRGNATNPMSYPVSYSVASSWNPDLYYKEATQIGDEIRESVSGRNLRLTFYSPTVNLARDPRWGRNDEGYGEDPYLAGLMGSTFTQGMEGKDRDGKLLDPNGYYKTVTTAKHYTANNSERNRLGGGAVMDERLLREYYTVPYRDMIKNADVSSIMTAYSTVNGVPASMSSYLMDTLLRQTWGFSGYVTSDCDSVSTITRHQYVNPYTGKVLTVPEQYAQALAHGEDLECSGGYSSGIGTYNSNMTNMLNGNIMTDKGLFTENTVDIAVHRLLTARMKLGEFDGNTSYVQAANDRLATYVAGGSNPAVRARQTQERLNLATEIGSDSVVLLKNDASERKDGSVKKLLPLDIPATGSFNVAIIGQWAQDTFLGGYSASPGATINIQTGITNAIKAINPNATITFYKGFTDSGTNVNTLNTVDQAAVTAAASADLCIVVAGTNGNTSAEDRDRTTIALPGAQAKLFSEVGKANKNTVALMETCGPVQVTTFENDVSAIVWSSFAGQNKGDVFANIITGKVNPSGKTTALWHKNVNDDGPSDITSIFDYQIYDGPGRTYMYFKGDVSYPFGYGLSYTTFDYTNLQLSKTALDANDTLTVSFDVKNTGTVKGAEVAELYVSQPNAPAELKRPIKRLRGFDKVTLAPNETKKITLNVKISDLAFFNEATGKYEIDSGAYQVQIGKSSSNIALNSNFTVSGNWNIVPEVLTAKPVQDGDAALDISERLQFNKNKVVNPQLTVAMNDESLFGYIIKGKSKALPTGATVTYTSNRPAVVSIDANNVIKTVKPGVATVTANLTYNGKTVSADFVIYVTSNPYPDGITVNGQSILGYKKDVREYSINVPDDVTTVPTIGILDSGNPDVVTEITQATAIPGVATIVATDNSTGEVATYKVGLTRSPKYTDFKGISALPNYFNTMNPVSEDVSYTANGVQIKSARGAFASATNKPKNIIMQSAGGDYVIQSKVTLSAAPSASNQQSGLLVYGDDNNYIRFVYERPTTGTTNVVRVYQVTNGTQTQRNTANVAAGVTNMYFQINKIGSVYTFLYSLDGVTWTTFATTVNVTYLTPYIGLWANNGDTAAASFNATFDRMGIYEVGDIMPRLSEITVDGAPLAGFSAEQLGYTLAYETSKDSAPVVAAKAANPKFTVEVTQATAIPGAAKIVVSSEVAKTTYTVYYNIYPTSASFVDGTMDNVWKIENEDKNEYSLDKGLGLRLPTQSVDVYNTARNWKNAFIRPAAGDWDVVAKVHYPVAPGANYQQIMLLAWQDEDNYIKLDCESAGLTVQLAREINGVCGGVGTTTTTKDADGSLTLYFKISKDGNKYTGSFSKDGINYTSVASTTADYQNLQIGVFATKNSNSAVIQTYCEYLTITRLNGVEVKTPDEMLQDAFDNVTKYVFADIPATTPANITFSRVPRGYTVSAVSSDPSIISNTGVVTRSDETKVVNYEVTVTDGVRSDKKVIPIAVQGLSISIDNRVNVIPVNIPDDTSLKFDPSFRIVAKEAINGKLYVASYDAQGVLIKVDPQEFSLSAGESIVKQASVDRDATTYKFYVWDNTCKPLTAATTVSEL